ncbi:MAG: hypothetical protein ABR552_02170 [Actinomycetota bacterium]
MATEDSEIKEAARRILKADEAQQRPRAWNREDSFQRALMWLFVAMAAIAATWALVRWGVHFVQRVWH